MVYGETGDTGASPEDVRIFEGTGGAAFAEQLIASGVKYIFGNSASDDAYFYEALVDRPKLTYILTPHEGPGFPADTLRLHTTSRCRQRWKWDVSWERRYRRR